MHSGILLLTFKLSCSLGYVLIKGSWLGNWHSCLSCRLRLCRSMETVPLVMLLMRICVLSRCCRSCTLLHHVWLVLRWLCSRRCLQCLLLLLLSTVSWMLESDSWNLSILWQSKLLLDCFKTWCLCFLKKDKQVFCTWSDGLFAVLGVSLHDLSPGIRVSCHL